MKVTGWGGWPSHSRFPEGRTGLSGAVTLNRVAMTVSGVYCEITHSARRSERQRCAVAEDNPIG
jgi:hypothetical protein